MGDERVSDSSSQPPGGGGENRSAPLTYTRIFNENFPYYLMLGMTYEQYWHGDCQLAVAYRKADRLKQERIDSEAWLQGLYTFHAIGGALSKDGKYLSEPFTLTYADKLEEQEQQVNPNKIAMEVFMVNYNEQYKRNKAKAGEKTGG